MENNFLEKEFDKFKNTTVTKSAYTYVVQDDKYSTTTIETCHVSAPSGNLLSFKVVLVNADDWCFLRNGKMILNINNVENIVLKPTDISTTTFHGNKFIIAHNFQRVDDACDDGVQRLYCIEVVSYAISQEILKKICDAKTVDVQISGDAGVGVVAEANVNGFIDDCRLFYNAFYDNEAYVNTVEEENRRIAKAESDEKARKTAKRLRPIAIIAICMIVSRFIWGEADLIGILLVTVALLIPVAFVMWFFDIDFW